MFHRIFKTNSKLSEQEGSPVVVETKVPGVGIYAVRWISRHGKYYSDIKPTMKAFTNLDDAETFKENLEKAQELLEYTENIHIKIERLK